MATNEFIRISEINEQRCRVWHGNRFVMLGDEHTLSDWNAADWSNAMQGEAGEFGNVVKKIRRQQTGVRGSVDPGMAVLLDKAGEEAADTFLYLDLACTYLGINFYRAIKKKFNDTSIREGFPHRL